MYFVSLCLWPAVATLIVQALCTLPVLQVRLMDQQLLEVSTLEIQTKVFRLDFSKTNSDISKGIEDLIKRYKLIILNMLTKHPNLKYFTNVS